jgi:hypothetical protein
MSVKCHYALLSFSSSSLYYHLHVGPMCQVTFNLQPFTLPLTHAIAAHLPPQSPRWLSLLPASPSAALAPPPSPVFLGSVFGIFRFGFRFFVPSLTLATVMKQGGEASGIGWRREVEGGGVGSSTGRGGLQLTLAGAGRPSHRSSPAAISPEEEERNTREEEERQGHAESFYPPRCPPSNMACFAGVPSRQKW